MWGKIKIMKFFSHVEVREKVRKNDTSFKRLPFYQMLFNFNKNMFTLFPLSFHKEKINMFSEKFYLFRMTLTISAHRIPSATDMIITDTISASILLITV